MCQSHHHHQAPSRARPPCCPHVSVFVSFSALFSVPQFSSSSSPRITCMPQIRLLVLMMKNGPPGGRAALVSLWVGALTLITKRPMGFGWGAPSRPALLILVLPFACMCDKSDPPSVRFMCDPSPPCVKYSVVDVDALMTTYLAKKNWRLSPQPSNDHVKPSSLFTKIRVAQAASDTQQRTLGRETRAQTR